LTSADPSFAFILCFNTNYKHVFAKLPLFKMFICGLLMW
jgi:hypothetical protein